MIDTVTIVPNLSEYRPGQIITSDETFIVYAVRGTYAYLDI